MTPSPFELFAIRYATHTGRSAADNFIGGDLHEAGSPLDYFVWVARRSDRVVLIDTGFAHKAAAQRGRSLEQTPVEALKALGIATTEIDDVILTHLHYDHAGTLNDFAGCRFHVQDTEMAGATGRCMCHAHMRQPYDVENIVDMLRLVYAGRVAFHDQDVELTDGLSLHRVGGHSPGLQVARVFTERGWVVLASDASHLYANMQTGRPFPIVTNVAEMLEGFQTVARLADSPDHIIPGHDPLVASLYPALSPELEKRVVRLDVAPGATPC